MSTGQRSYDKGQGRRFALTLAAAFGSIALFTMWRDRDGIARVTGVLAGILFVAALVAPARLGPVEAAWMKFAHAISRVTTPIFMGIVYFVVLTPAGIIRRTFGRNPLVHPADGGSFWAAREKREPAVGRRRMERQF